MKRMTILLLLTCVTSWGQKNSINYGLFDKTLGISLLPVLPAEPQPASLGQYGNTGFFRKDPTPGKLKEDMINPLPIGAVNSRQVQAMADLERDLMEMDSYRKDMEARKRGQSYRQAFAILSRFNPDSFSLTKAVYLVENAYFDGQLSEATYLEAIRDKVILVQKIMAAEGLSTKQDVALNFGIQKLFSQNGFYTSANSPVAVPAFKYDFEDFFGQKDYTKMFVSKALATGKGQCHSLPLLYLVIAEQLAATAQLSLAPQHTFIQFRRKDGKLLNFETTNGHLVSNNWLTQSGYITSVALQRKTYLSPLSKRQLFAHVLSDLLLGYMSKFSYDVFAEQVRQQVLQINPANLTALIVDANIKTLVAKEKVRAAGTPKEEDLPKYPEAYQACSDLRAAYEKVETTGFQDMPKEAYQKWLLSIEQEKKRQAGKISQGGNKPGSGKAKE